jgi:pantoate--beta-alanine ligase
MKATVLQNLLRRVNRIKLAVSVPLLLTGRLITDIQKPMLARVATIEEIRSTVKQWRAANLTIAFVPTMGFLHEGHLSLIRAAKKEHERCILSIFINPAQFGPNEDLDRYPRDLEGDCAKAESAGTDLLFLPTAESLYPDGYRTYVLVNHLSNLFCGKSRPTHFQGVTTIVCKLFHIVTPDCAYFGQKDAQQAFLIRKMVCDLNMDLAIKVQATVREIDGLAMSSRNSYLSLEERRAATVLFRALSLGLQQFSGGERDPKAIETILKRFIESEPLARIDYVAVVDAATFEEATAATGSFLILMAVFIGKTRLIDNMSYTVEPET